MQKRLEDCYYRIELEKQAKKRSRLELRARRKEEKRLEAKRKQQEVSDAEFKRQREKHWEKYPALLLKSGIPQGKQGRRSSQVPLGQISQTEMIRGNRVANCQSSPFVPTLTSLPRHGSKESQPAWFLPEQEDGARVFRS
jgi:hypothetical protein